MAIDTSKKELEDGLDFFELAANLWSGKWIILLITLVFLSFGFYFSSKLTTSYNGTIDLREINIDGLSNYIAINTSRITKQQGDIVTYVKLPEITSSKLSKLFMYKAFSYEQIRKSIAKNSNAVLLFKGSNTERVALINGLAKSFEFKINPGEKNILTFITQDTQEAELIINEALLGINEDIRNVLLEQFNLFKNTIKINQKAQENELQSKHSLKISGLKAKYNNLVFDFKLDNAERIAFLNEQYDIALKLGIQDNKIQKMNGVFIKQIDEYLNYTTKNNLLQYSDDVAFTSLDFDLRQSAIKKLEQKYDSQVNRKYLEIEEEDVFEYYYLSGTEHLINEINTLENIYNTDFTNISDQELAKLLPDLLRVRNDIKNLDNSFNIDSVKNDMSIQIDLIESAVNLSPLKSKNFQSMEYDTSLIRYSSLTKQKSQRIIYLSVLLGIVFSISFILFRVGFRNHLRKS